MRRHVATVRAANGGKFKIREKVQMTPEQEKVLIEAVRYLLRERQIASRIEARQIANANKHDRIRECISDVDYCQKLLDRL